MTRLLPPSGPSRFSGILFLLPLLFLFCSCSDEDPGDPSHSPEGAITIGVDGGSSTLNDQVHLYIPAGTVSTPTIFSLEEIYSPPAPPSGCMQVGPAFTVTGNFPGETPVALAVEFDYGFTGELTGRLVLLSRWDESSGWEAIESQGGYFPLGLGVTVSKPGTFAAHLDTTGGESDDVFSTISLSSTKSLGNAGADPQWRTALFANFWNSDQSERLWDAGGSVQMGQFILGAENYYVSNEHEIDPGASYQIKVPGGENIPSLLDTLQYFVSDLVLNNPPLQGETISRLNPWSVTWDGAGPQLVWLAIYGDGADGSFHFNGKMRPNMGEFIFTSEEMSSFEPGAEVMVFLNRTVARPLAHEGFHHSSFFIVECGSTMKVVLE